MTTITVTLGEDLVLLSLMLIGLRRYGDVGMYGLWRFLHRQVRWYSRSNLMEIESDMSIRGFYGLFSSLSRRSPQLCVPPLMLAHG